MALIKCKECGEKIESTLKTCPKCGCTIKKEEKVEATVNLSSENHKKSMNKEFNSLATFIKVIAWLVIIAGLFIGIANGSDSDDFKVTLINWVYYFSAGISCLVIAEVIQILHDIRVKIYKK